MPNTTVVFSSQALAAYPTFTFSDWQNTELWGQLNFEIYPSDATGVDVVLEFADAATTTGLQEVVEDTANATTTLNDFIVPIKRFVWRWASISPFKIPIPTGNTLVRIGVAGAAGTVSVNLKRVSQSAN